MDMKPIIVLGTNPWGTLLASRLGLLNMDKKVRLEESETDLEMLLEEASYIIDTREESHPGLSRFGRIIHLPASFLEDYSEGLELIEKISQTSCRLGELREIIKLHNQSGHLRSKKQKFFSASLNQSISFFRFPEGSLRTMRDAT